MVEYLMLYSEEHFNCDEQGTNSVESALRVVVRNAAQDVYLFLF